MARPRATIDQAWEDFYRNAVAMLREAELAEIAISDLLSVLMVDHFVLTLNPLGPK
jgi:hypothetical protein